MTAKTYQWQGSCGSVATVGRSLRDQPTAELGNPCEVNTKYREAVS